MQYDDEIEKLEKNEASEAIRGVGRVYEAVRRENFLRWIDKYPEYWHTMCEVDKKDISPEYAQAVMKTLLDSNILELQMVWLYKCNDVMDIFGNAFKDVDASE